MKNDEDVKQDWQTPEIFDLDIDLTSKTTYYLEFAHYGPS